MISLVETSSGLVISYPLWLGILSVAGIALFAYAARPKAEVKKRWGILVVAVLLAWAGIYFATFKATLTAESGLVYGFLRYNERIDWRDAAAAAVVQRSGKGGPSYFLVVAGRTGGEFELPLGGLNDGERQRVITYVLSKLPR